MGDSRKNFLQSDRQGHGNKHRHVNEQTRNSSKSDEKVGKYMFKV